MCKKYENRCYEIISMKMKNGLAVATAFNNEKFRPPFCSMAYTDSVKTYLNRITFC